MKLFHIHDWQHSGEKQKWEFSNGRHSWQYPFRKCVKCARMEALDWVGMSVNGWLNKAWIQI